MERHSTHSSMGLEGFKYIYFHLCRNQFRKSLKWSVFSTIVIVLCGIIMSSKNSFQLVSIVADAGLKIAPPLLGFTLSSFALVVGFKDDVLMQKLKNYQTSNGISMYLQLVVTFIAMLGSVFICLLLCVIFHLILAFDIKVCDRIFEYVQYINYACFAFLTFFVFYALFAIKDLLSNLFSLGRSSDNLHKAKQDLRKIHGQYTEVGNANVEYNNIFVYIFIGILNVLKVLRKIFNKK